MNLTGARGPKNPWMVVRNKKENMNHINYRTRWHDANELGQMARNLYTLAESAHASGNHAVKNTLRNQVCS